MGEKVECIRVGTRRNKNEHAWEKKSRRRGTPGESEGSYLSRSVFKKGDRKTILREGRAKVGEVGERAKLTIQMGKEGTNQ